MSVFTIAAKKHQLKEFNKFDFIFIDNFFHLTLNVFLKRNKH